VSLATTVERLTASRTRSAGLIDRAKAKVFADELATVDWSHGRVLLRLEP